MVVNIAWVELHRKICYSGLRASSLFNITQGHHNSFIRVHHAKIPVRMPSIENNTRIWLFVTEPYLMNSLLLNVSVLPCDTSNMTISAYKLGYYTEQLLP